jgi:hypothetical protein
VTVAEYLAGQTVEQLVRMLAVLGDSAEDRAVEALVVDELARRRPDVAEALAAWSLDLLSAESQRDVVARVLGRKIV